MATRFQILVERTLSTDSLFLSVVLSYNPHDPVVRLTLLPLVYYETRLLLSLPGVGRFLDSALSLLSVNGAAMGRRVKRVILDGSLGSCFGVLYPRPVYVTRVVITIH